MLENEAKEQAISDYQFNKNYLILIARLKVAFHFEWDSNQGYLSKFINGKCPSCGEKHLSFFEHRPFFLKCPGKWCDWSSTAAELQPDLFSNFNERYPQTAENLTATADAFMLFQGFDITQITGWYDQGSFGNTPTVSFLIAPGVAYEILTDPVTLQHIDGSKVTRTDNHIGSYKNRWWQPPELEIKYGDTVFITGSIFDAIALNTIGFKAVSVFANKDGYFSFPRLNLLDSLKGVTWVLAFSQNEKGDKAVKKFYSILEELGYEVDCCAPTEKKSDLKWHDLLLRNELSKSDFKKHWHFGRMRICKTSSEKGRLLYIYKRWQAFTFEFNRRIYAFEFDNKLFEQLKKAEGIAEINDDTVEYKGVIALLDSFSYEICSAELEYLYIEMPKEGDDVQYIFRVKYPNGDPDMVIGLNGRVFKTAGAFKEALQIHAPGALFKGSTAQVDWMYDIWSNRRKKIVRTLDFVGYDKDIGVYLYSDYAVKDGTVIKKNRDEYFDLGKTGGMKVASGVKLELTEQFNNGWFNDYCTAFSTKGLVTLTFWFGSLFAEQIRATHKEFPWLELSGPANSGKTDMVLFNWKLVGRTDYEGIDATKSTFVGNARTLLQASNLPTVLVESDHEKNPFDFTSIKSTFDGKLSRATGKKNVGNDTYSPPFRGTLVIEQNAQVPGDEPTLTRIVQNWFDGTHHTPEGYQASLRLRRMDVQEVSGFLLHCITKEKSILERFNQLLFDFEDRLRECGKVKHERIIRCHAKIQALAHCLPLVLPIDNKTLNDLTDYITALAIKRQESLNTDHSEIIRFWEVYEHLNVRVIDGMNHSPHPDRYIAIHLETFMIKVADFHFPAFVDKELRRLFETSKRHKFVEVKNGHSAIENKTMRLYHFLRGN